MGDDLSLFGSHRSWEACSHKDSDELHIILEYSWDQNIFENALKAIWSAAKDEPKFGHAIWLWS